MSLTNILVARKGYLELWLRYLGFLKPYYFKGVQAALLMAVGLAVSIMTPLISMYIFDTVIAERSLSALNTLLLVLIGLALAQASSLFLQQYVLVTYRAKVIRDIRMEVYGKVLRLPLSFFKDKTTGHMMMRMGGDVIAANGLLADTILDFLFNLLTFVIAFGIMLWLHWKLALLAVAIIPMILLTSDQFNRRVRHLTEIVRNRHALLSSALQESIANVHVIKAFTMEQADSGKHEVILSSTIDSDVRHMMFTTFSGALIKLITSIFSALFIWYAIHEIFNENLTIGQFLAMVILASRLYRPVESLMQLNLKVQTSLIAAKRVFDILDSKEERYAPASNPKPGCFKKEIAFKNVSLTFAGNKRVLQGVNMRIRKGERVAIVGASGTGKTTLVNLLCGFYSPDSGSIDIDGVDTRSLGVQELRKLIGLVPQDNHLFSGTIKENILVGNRSASLADVMAAARIAQADGFIRGLPDGYDTFIGEGGFGLSDGQKQRLAVARAILKDAPILVLDEATSSLDSETEFELLRGIFHNLAQKTIIVIAHRLSAIISVDRIFVLEGGRIVEEGCHEALWGRAGTYRKLYWRQIAEKGLGMFCT